MDSKRKATSKFSDLFQKFRHIPYQGYEEYIAFCNFHFKEIQDLKFDEYIEIKFAYIKAIYNLDRAYLFYKIVDQTIYEILNQQVFTEQYKYIYKQVLLLKAKRLLEEKKIQAAKGIYTSIYSIDSQDTIIKGKLFQIILKQRLFIKVKYFGITVIGLIITLTLSAAVNFFIIPFFPKLEILFNQLILGFFIFSISIFAKSSSIAYYEAKKELRQIHKTPS